MYFFKMGQNPELGIFYKNKNYHLELPSHGPAQAGEEKKIREQKFDDGICVNIYITK